MLFNRRGLFWRGFGVWLTVAATYFSLVAAPVWAQESNLDLVTFGDLLERLRLEEDSPLTLISNKTFGLLIAEPVALSPKPNSEPDGPDPDTEVTKSSGFARISQAETPVSDLDQLFTLYGRRYQVDEAWLKRIALCESSLNPRAANDIYAGLFQFSPTTWAATQKRLGLDPNPDLRFDAEASIQAAAFKISQDGAGAWPACQRLTTQ